MSAHTKRKRQSKKILKNCSCLFQCVAQQRNHEFELWQEKYFNYFNHTQILNHTQICLKYIVRTVHTINFYLSYFAQHQKIAHRDFEKLEGRLQVGQLCAFGKQKIHVGRCRSIWLDLRLKSKILDEIPDPVKDKAFIRVLVYTFILLDENPVFGRQLKGMSIFFRDY